MALSGLLDRHFSRLYAFLKAGAWSLSAVRQRLFAPCLVGCAVYGDWRKPLGYWTLAQQKRLSQQACRVSAGSYTDALSAQFQGAEALAA